MENIITEIEQKIKICSDSTKESRARKGAYVDCLVMVRKANGIKPQLCDSLPDDKEIEFVASDESNGVDVDDLKSRPIWADGFIEGAKWMRSRIK